MNVIVQHNIRRFANDLGLSLNDVALIYTDLIEDMKRNVLDLKSLIELKDRNSILQDLHKIKGISANFRMPDIYWETVRIHSQIKNNRHTDLKWVLHPLFKMIENSIGHITEYFESNRIH